VVVKSANPARGEAILSALFLGRLVKYSVFGWVATCSPGALRYLGVKMPGGGGEGGKKGK
jgi:hypothetical protein